MITLEQHFRDLYHKRLVYHSTLLGVLVTLVGAGIWRGDESHHYLAIAAGGLAIGLFATVSPSMLRRVYCQTLKLSVARERLEVRSGFRTPVRLPGLEESEECPDLAASLPFTEALGGGSVPRSNGEAEILFPFFPSSARVRELSRHDRFAPRFAAIVFAAIPLLLLSLPGRRPDWWLALGILAGVALFRAVYSLAGYRRRRGTATFELKWCPEKRVPEVATALSMGIALLLLVSSALLEALDVPRESLLVHATENAELATVLWSAALVTLGFALLFTLVWSKGVGDARARLFEFREDAHRLEEPDLSSEERGEIRRRLAHHVTEVRRLFEDRLTWVGDQLPTAEALRAGRSDPVDSIRELAKLGDPDTSANLTGLPKLCWDVRLTLRWWREGLMELFDIRLSPEHEIPRRTVIRAAERFRHPAYSERRSIFGTLAAFTLLSAAAVLITEALDYALPAPLHEDSFRVILGLTTIISALYVLIIPGGFDKTASALMNLPEDLLEWASPGIRYRHRYHTWMTAVWRLIGVAGFLLATGYGLAGFNGAGSEEVGSPDASGREVRVVDRSWEGSPP